MANIGKCLKLKHISKTFNDLGNSWMLDSGATDHMTFDSKHFITYNPCPSNGKVQTTYGSMLTVAGVGKVNNDSLSTLDEVLHIPKLCINLISVQKIAKISSYSILFDDDDSFLINKLSSQKIGLARSLSTKEASQQTMIFFISILDILLFKC